MLLSMNRIKGSEPLPQNSYSSNQDCSWSPEEQGVLADFFLLLNEIDQQANVPKEEQPAVKESNM